jgi:hypothetical protein
LDVLDQNARYAAWSDIQLLLPAGTHEQIRTKGALGRVQIAYARAFSLDVAGDASDPRIDPVLHSAGEPAPSVEGISVEDDDSAGLQSSGLQPHNLLPPKYADAFSRNIFTRFGTARPTYALGDDWYVVLAPPLQKALDVVRKVQQQTALERRSFISNPRAWLGAELGDQYDETVIESLFIETMKFSERVRGLGIRQPKIVPWLQAAREPWLPPLRFGLMVDGERLEIPAAELPAAIATIERAIANGMTTADLAGRSVPATVATITALRTLMDAAVPLPAESAPPAEQASSSAADDTEVAERQVLIIEDNLESLTFERNFRRRKPELVHDQPSGLNTILKEHQREGLLWLQGCWQQGRPGSLLADDMGLGKTLQALAFLSWLREAMDAGRLPAKPVLVVAPTGLLANWQRENALHFAPQTLGLPIAAYGSAIKGLRVRGGPESQSQEPVLDLQRMANARWIVSTYETVRDYQISFARIGLAVVVFDEAQKIKTPGTLATEAAKALKSDFIIAMTGTPIENRLADLWCLMDTVQPGMLGDLSGFSRRYESTGVSTDDIARLRQQLVAQRGSAPAIMCRRMKTEVLDGLPDRRDHVLEKAMPPEQAAAYDRLIDEHRRDSSRGSMLKVLQAIRAVSLHPGLNADEDDDTTIARSARYIAMFEALDRIVDRREKALVFCEFLEPLAHLSTIIQRRYRLGRTPVSISGEVAGTRRQDRVDAFQQRGDGFDVMLMTPKAGGVGLTLTAANNVIHLTRWWNPAVEDQCTDRVYRIGQARPVNVFFPQAILPEDRDHSFDVRLGALLARKRRLSRELLAAPAGTEQDANELYNETVAFRGTQPS